MQIERRIAPFWRGLNEHLDSWTEYQLVAVARGRPVPAADAIPPEDQYGPLAMADPKAVNFPNAKNPTAPITSRSQSYNSDSSSSQSASSPGPPSSGTVLPAPAPAPGPKLFRGRAKTLANPTTPSKNPHTYMTPREMNLPKDPFVNGQPIEAYLYKDATECPICFLYYPPYLNKTRCCDQAICSECFVQIKRPDPHLPEHSNPHAAVTSENSESRDLDGEETLVSEPAACPFCVQPEFGITYETPSFRRGLTYINHAPSNPLNNASSAMSSSSSLGSAISGGGRLSPTSFGRRRTTSISASSPAVITTDRVRPDWHQKLTSARAHAARRSAAATALHTAAYLMGNRNEADGRGFGSFGRRGILRRASGTDSLIGAGNNHLNMLALMSERYGGLGARGDMSSNPDGDSSIIASSRGSSRRNGMDDLEEMMMMEAIRLSLASEEERRKREEKETKKEAKKKEKENKKAEKMARKVGVYSISTNHSTAGFESSTNESSPVCEDFPPHHGKGKGVQQSSPELSTDGSSGVKSSSAMKKAMPAVDAAAEGLPIPARAQLQSTDGFSTSITPALNPYRPSHLRKLSNASSLGSSVADAAAASLNNDFRRSNSSFEASPNSSGVNILARVTTQNTYISGTPPGGGAVIEPMFNFRSLAAMVGEDEKLHGSAEHQENSTHDDARHLGRGAEHSNVASKVIEYNMDGHVAELLQGTARLESDKMGPNAFREVEEKPRLEIPSPTRANSYQRQNAVGAVKTMEANMSIDSARPVS